jgi:hypothetical protein
MFDTHTPILYNKYKFQSLQSIDWSIPYGYGIKSLYANSNNIEGILMKDGKLFASETKKERIFRKISELPCFSTSPIIPMAQREIIQSLYEKKSIFEK